MQHYREARKLYPIEQIENEVRVLEQLALGEAVRMHWKEATEILKRAEDIAVCPHAAKRMAMLRQEWADNVLLYGP